MGQNGLVQALLGANGRFGHLRCTVRWRLDTFLLPVMQLRTHRLAHASSFSVRSALFADENPRRNHDHGRESEESDSCYRIRGFGSVQLARKSADNGPFCPKSSAIGPRPAA